VLHAVDDLLVEVGYAALTMTAIAERAGVGRQTVYRWWSSKAEVLFEATMIDAGRELAVEPRGTTLDELAAFVDAVVRFLTASEAGAGYRALVGEAQHDPQVAHLMESSSLFDGAVDPVLARAVDRGDLAPTADRASVTAMLVGPVLFRVLTDGPLPDPHHVARAALAVTT
jgi:AcrR family transcriptional regulator